MPKDGCTRAEFEYAISVVELVHSQCSISQLGLRQDSRTILKLLRDRLAFPENRLGSLLSGRYFKFLQDETVFDILDQRYKQRPSMVHFSGGSTVWSRSQYRAFFKKGLRMPSLSCTRYIKIHLGQLELGEESVNADDFQEAVDSHPATSTKRKNNLVVIAMDPASAQDVENALSIIDTIGTIAAAENDEVVLRRYHRARAAMMYHDVAGRRLEAEKLFRHNSDYLWVSLRSTSHVQWLGD